MKLKNLFKENGLLSGKRVLAIVSSLTLIIGFTLGTSAGSHTWGSQGNIEYMDPDTSVKTTVFDKSDLEYLDNRITEVEADVSDGKKQIAEELNTWDIASDKVLSTTNPTFDQILGTMGYIKSIPNAGLLWTDANRNQNYLMGNGLVTTNVNDAKKDSEGNAETLIIAAAHPENLSAGTAAWVNGNFIIGTGADNNSYYNLGYMDGFANSLDNVEVSYIYHVHTDNSDTKYDADTILYSVDNPGGCFIANGHTHDKTGTCESKTIQTGTRLCGTWDCYSNDGYHQKFRCTGCGSTREQYLEISGSGWGLGDHYVETYSTSYTCGEPINTWKIGCGKTDQTIESATIQF